MTDWTNKIVGYAEVDPDQLLAHPMNHRRHPVKQREALRASLNDLGWISPVIVNRLSGHVLDGHARIEEALTKGCQVPVAYVELEPAKEAEALAIFDRITDLAEIDAEALDALLREVATGETAIQELLSDLATEAGLTPTDWLPQGLPEPGMEGWGEESKRVIMVFASAEEQAEFWAALGCEPEDNRVLYHWGDLDRG